MSRVEKAQPSHLDIHLLTSPESQRALDVLLNLLSSCAGPSGKIHMVRNSCGGHTTFSSNCTRLLAAILISRPELKLIVTSIQAHLKQHHDGGLFMASICLYLIKSSLGLETQLHIHNSLYELFGQIVSEYLNSSNCKICVNADFTDLQVLLAFVGSIMKSKRLLDFTRQDCSNFSKLVVKAFVESIPSQVSSTDIRHSNGVHVISIDKRHVKESRLEQGLLLEYPELSTVKGVIKLNPKTVSRGGKNENSSGVSTDSCVMVALFTCSMSGDVEEAVDATFEVTKQQSEYVENMVLTKMTELCDVLEGSDVGLILCQKVIHPKVKATLRSKGILFLDRLGSQVVPYLQDLTGAKPIASVMMTVDASSHLGMVESVSHVVVEKKSYLLLTNASACVVTLILCAPWEEKLAELRSCVRQSLQGLYSLSREPRLLAGGGCWQTHCSYILKSKVLHQLPVWAEKSGCTEAQVITALSAFRASLHHWVKTLADDSEHVVVDPSSYHCWRIPKGQWTDVAAHETSTCCCGMKSVAAQCLQDFDMILSQEHLSSVTPDTCDVDKISLTDNPVHSELILDNFSAASQALFKGIFTADLVLSVGLFISDKN